MVEKYCKLRKFTQLPRVVKALAGETASLLMFIFIKIWNIGNIFGQNQQPI